MHTHGKGQTGLTIYTQARIVMVLTGLTCAQKLHFVKDGFNGPHRQCVELVLRHVLLPNLCLPLRSLIQKRSFTKQGQTIKDLALRCNQDTHVIVHVHLDFLPNNVVFVTRNILRNLWESQTQHFP